MAGLMLLACCEDQGTSGGAPPPPRVVVAAPVSEVVQTFETLNARAAAAERVEVRARVAGLLTEQRFDPGDAATEGQVLFIIEPAPYQAALESAKAQLQEATVNHGLAEVFLGRVEEVHQQGAASDWEVEEARARVAVAEAEIQVATARVAKAELDLSYTTVTSPI
ncbi:MAG: biotin/lipoyl-binding protein, partial [Phycisphaerales bacterium]|nr:biotin/lipoyl-binding protein [Phycisphaerales bacterium]